MATSKYGKWNIEKSLSEGGQAQTFLVSSEEDGNKKFVLKRLKNKDRIGRFINEIKAGLELDHPNILKIIDYDHEWEKPYLVSEYCEFGTLANSHVHKLPILHKLEIFRQICLGVAHAHGHTIPVIHRDLKPENIFIKDPEFTPVVGDFGICFLQDNGERFTITEEVVGPRWYTAPELEDGRVDAVSPASDVYSLGKILYWMLAQKIFSREKYRDPEYNLAKDQITPVFYIINELLDKMIVLEPKQRLQNAGEVVKHLDIAIERIIARSHVIDIDTPQPCMYCGLGFYQPRINYHTNSSNIATSVRNFGFTPVGSSEWIIFVCEYCGNVQLFRPDYAKKNKMIWAKRSNK